MKRERGLSFEEIVRKINKGKLLDDIKNTNIAKYPNQRIFVVEIENYVYLVPYVENDNTNEIFLKTVFPSRKMTKKYLGVNKI